MWNLILSEINENTIIPNKNNINPEKSGKYVCTCLVFLNGVENYRYLQIMQYNKEKNHWHDINSEGHISHNILAWTDKINVCNFKNFEYIPGGYFISKEK